MSCDYFGCSQTAVASFPILDEDGEDQGSERLCLKHAPYYKKSSCTEHADESLNEFLSRLKHGKVSGLTAVTDPLDFNKVQKLVTQTESLNQIQNNIRSHKSL